MRIFRTLSNQGTTIVCTTHVVENADLMDRLLILVNGRTDFAGHADAAKTHYQVGQLTDMYEKLEEQAQAEREREAQAAGKPSKRGLVERFFGKIGKGIGRIAAAFQNDLPMLVSQTTSRATNFSMSLKSAGEVSTGLLRGILIRIPPTRTLLRRRMHILLTDPKNVALLAMQPLIVGVIAGAVVPQVTVKLFFLHLTTFWLGCNNSAQEIVKEMNIYRRERFVGLSIHSYLTSKVIFGMIVTLAQAAILYTCVYTLSDDLGQWFNDETPWVHIHLYCMVLTAAAGVSIGLVISSLSRTHEIALFAVPLILIPQILFSGGVVPLSEWQGDSPDDGDKVTMGIVHAMPGFASQRMMDTSRMYQADMSITENITRILPGDRQLSLQYRNPYDNLKKDYELGPWKPLEVLKPAYLGGALLFGFFVAGYWISALALKVRERE